MSFHSYQLIFIIIHYSNQMANIHRIGDYRNNNNNQSNQNISGLGLSPNADSQFLKNCSKYRIPFFQINPFKPARQSNYCDFLTNTFCPVLKCCSFTTIICIIDIALFIAEVSVGLNVSGQFLEVTASTLDMFKGLRAIPVYRGEIYRLLTPIVLHANFMHIFGNLISTLILLSRVEYTYGIIYTFFIYFLSGLCGNIFSCVCQTNFGLVSVGASTSLYGLLGLLIGYVIINWVGLDFMGPRKVQLLCMLLLMLFFVIIITFLNMSGGTDYYSHLGGFLGGLWLAGLPPTIINNRRQKILRIICFCLFIIQIVTCFAVFFLGKPDLKLAAV